MPLPFPSLRTLAWLAAALLMMALMARLGWWQLDRAAQKLALQHAIVQRGALPALPAAELARDAATATAQLHRRTVLTGRWLDRFTVFLENRQMGGRPGFFVITPLQLAPNDAVLVQRGWVPRDPRDRTALPSLPLPEGDVEVAGRIATAPSRLFEFGAAEPGRIRQNLDPDAYSREIGLPLRPVSLLQLDVPGQPASADGLLREWPAPAADVHKHYGYALQWFAFSALTAVLYVWFQFLRPRFAKPRL